VTLDSLPPALRWVVQAAQSKKAMGVTMLDLEVLGAFTNAFVICSGASSRQVQAISDEVEQQLERRGARMAHREGYDVAEWVLLDYGDFVVHIFNERARLYYDLERLWRAARRIEIPDQPGAGAAEPPFESTQGVSE
jgi:ribosome-associated protein